MFVNLFKNILNIIIQSNTYKNHRQELKRSKTGNFLKKIGVIEVHIIPIFEKKKLANAQFTTRSAAESNLYCTQFFTLWPDIT